MTGTPQISIVVPVLGEAERIGDLIAHLRQRDAGGRCEIIVVDGDAEGSTLSAVSDSGVVQLKSARGRSRQMNAGAAVARGDVLLFLHADTLLPERALADLTAALADQDLVGGAFWLGFDADSPIYRGMARVVSVATAVTRRPYGDQAIFLRRDYFEKIGGYAPIPVLEDVELSRRIRRRGDRIRVLRTPVTTSARRFQSEGLVRCVLRNAGIQLLYAFGVGPRRLARYYPEQPTLQGAPPPVPVVADPVDNS